MDTGQTVLGLDEPRARKERLEALRVDLWSSGASLRARAAISLREFGSEAVEPLCTALSDRSQDVRVAAAESLGCIGDPAAVQPLMEALRATFVGHSARRQLMMGFLVAAAAVTLVLGFIWGSIALKTGGMAYLFFQGFGRVFKKYFEKRHSRSRECAAISDALGDIAERNPTPAMRAVLPELKLVAADVLQQAAATRAVSQDAARRIETLTEKLKDLPVPAAAGPAADQASLPRPAEAPADTITLGGGTE